MLKYILTLLLSTSCCFLYAQDTYSVAVDIQQGAEGIVAFKVQEDGFWILGNSRCYPFYDECLVLAKLNTEGALVWYKRYQSPTNKIKPGSVTGNQGIYRHNDSTFYISGILLTEDAGLDGIIMKTNEVGDSSWMKRYGGLYDDLNRTVLPYSDSSLLTLSNFGIANQGVSVKTWLFITDLQGNLLWEKLYGDQFGATIAQDIIWAKDSSLLLTYISCETTACHYTELNSLRIAKLDYDLEVIWDKKVWDIEAINEGKSTILQLNNGNILLTYYRDNDQGGFFFPPILLWLDSSGDIITHYEFPVDRLSYFTDLFQTSDGKAIVVGTADIIPEGISETAGWIMAYTPEGELLWERRIKDGRAPLTSIILHAGTELPDGSLVFGGSIKDTLAGKQDLWLLKLDADGCFEPGCGEFQVITSTREVPLLFKGYEVFPNPVKSGSSLTLQRKGVGATAHFYTLVDALGRERQRQTLASGDAQPIPTQQLEPGLYFLQLWSDAGKLIQVEKVVVE